MGMANEYSILLRRSEEKTTEGHSRASSPVIVPSSVPYPTKSNIIIQFKSCMGVATLRISLAVFLWRDLLGNLR